MVARRAHNPEVTRSKRVAATFFFFFWAKSPKDTAPDSVGLESSIYIDLKV